MKVTLLNLIPTQSPELLRVTVLFERRKEFGNTPVAPEGVRVELHIESSGSYATIQRRALEKAREFLEDLVSDRQDSSS